MGLVGVPVHGMVSDEGGRRQVDQPRTPQASMKFSGLSKDYRIEDRRLRLAARTRRLRMKPGQRHYLEDGAGVEHGEIGRCQTHEAGWFPGHNKSLYLLYQQCPFLMARLAASVD